MGYALNQQHEQRVPVEQRMCSGHIKLTSSANAIRDFNGNSLLNNTSGTLTLGNAALNIGAVYQVGTSADQSFKNGADTDLFIQVTTGNVGIGDTTPDATLDVDSTATTGNAFGILNTSFTTGEAVDITTTHAPADGSTNEAIDLNITHTPTSSSDNFRSIDLDTSDGT